MPAKSQKQANLMRAAQHGATFAKARQIRASMSLAKIGEFTHVEHPIKNLKHFAHPKRTK